MRRPSARNFANGDRVEFEKLEDRNLLSTTTGQLFNTLPAGQEQLILNHLANQTETSYLQQGANSLQLLDVTPGHASQTAVFGQMMEGLPVHGNFIYVEITGNDQILNVEDRGDIFVATADSKTPDLDLATAQVIAHTDIGTSGAFESQGELVWFQRSDMAELAWRVETLAPGANTNQTNLEFRTVVDAQTGDILSQVQKPSVINGPIDQSEISIFPRIVINDDIGPAGSQAYADPFDSVVSTPGCTGTLIAANVVISARHCGTDAGGTVNFGEDSSNPIFTATVESSILPDGNGTLLDGGDVAILILTGDVPETVATPMRFIDATDDLVGQTTALIGYGLNGVGSVGHQGSSDGLRWGGENVIDEYGVPAGAAGANIISTDFDDGSAGANTIPGSDPTPLEFEATTAPGDSGGPVLINTGSEWAIAGVLSGGTSPTSQFGDISWWTGTAVFREDIEAVGGEFVTFGELEVSFEDEVVEDGSTFDFGVTSLGTTITHTFTVTNRDDANDLELFEPITVPDAWTISQSFDDLLLSPGESTTFEVRFDSNPYGTYEGELSFESGDGDESPFNLTLKAIVAPPVGEAGTVEAGGRFQTIFLRNTYIDPVVIAGPATFNDSDPVTIRVRNVTSDSFQVRAQEWSYETGIHQAERISYVVMESGIHRLPDGTAIIAENTDGVTTNYGNIPFQLSFEDTPVVLAQTVTTNGGAPVTTRLTGINSDGFQIKIQEEEAADQTHNPETISWMAVLPNQNDLGTSQQESVITGRIVDEEIATIPFMESFDVAPVFLANMQSSFGSNPATLRAAEITNDSVSLFVEEEQSRDEEVGHGFESVGYMAIESGDIVGRTIIGETGQVFDLDRNWQLVELEQEYLDPVVVVSANSFNEQDPGVVRVRNVTSNSFEMHFEEWNYLDLNHAPESASYIVFEAGIHKLRDGTTIEARNSMVNDEWTPINFDNDFGDEAPLVFSQIASINGPSTATTRLKNVTPDTFEVSVQEEEASATKSHNLESVSWIAMQAARGDTGGIFYEALMHDEGVNHIVATTIPFSNTFDEAPAVIARQQTTIGTNTAAVRQTFISSGRVELFVEEEQSFDKEIGHVREDVAVLALTVGVIDGYLITLPGDGLVSNARSTELPPLATPDMPLESRMLDNFYGAFAGLESSVTPDQMPVNTAVQTSSVAWDQMAEAGIFEGTGLSNFQTSTIVEDAKFIARDLTDANVQDSAISTQPFDDWDNIV